MRPGAHIAAAVEVLDEILTRHRPAATALADWGKNHRFAGSGDRSAIGNLVYDALRRRRSLAAQMGSDTPARLALAAAPRALGQSVEAVIASADGSPHALDAVERGRAGRPLARPSARHPRRYPGRHPRLARPLVPARIRRRGGRGRSGARPAGPGRYARQRPQGRPRARAEGARPLLRRADALLAGRRAHRRPRGSRPPAQRRGRDRARQGLVRGAGRGLADRRAAGQRRPPRAGARHLCRRRRQDAGDGRGHAQHRPDLRLRRRSRAPAPDLRAAEAGRRAQCPGPECRRPGGAAGARAPIRPRV